MSAPLLAIEGLSVDLPTKRGMLHAVRDVSFTLAPRETLCLVGESGCGKSTTALALLGLLPEGARHRRRRFTFAGEDLTATSATRLPMLRGARMTMIFQEPASALNPVLTIGGQLNDVYRCHTRTTRGAARDRAVELMQRVGIANAGDRLRQYPHQLSGGLRQRVMIAMALMCRPSLVIADEPTSALDVTVQAQILRLLADLQQETGIAILLITHDLAVVARASHRVAVMYAGEIVESADTPTLFADPRHPYTRGLMGAMLTAGGPHANGRVRPIPGAVPSLIGDVSGCAFRTRCSSATSACADTVAMRTESGRPSHSWRCVLGGPPPADA